MSILDSAANVLRLFARSECDLTVTDIVTGLNLPKSSASRLLKQMMECGLLERDAQTLAYRPALLLLEVSHQVRAATPLLRRMEQELEALVHESGHTGYISVLDETGTSVVVLRVHHGTHPLRVVTWPGHRSPAISTSTGRALLARLDDATVDARFAALVAKAAPRSPRDLASLQAGLARVRQEGWSLALNEALPGVGSLSCAVADPISGETLAFCLSFPSDPGQSGDIESLAQRLTGHARSIGRAIGDPFWNQ
jgi:DNA-binding IclR family transcriptional regulator